jgi:serine/threonine protein kinase
MTLPNGAIVGDYEIVGVLGQGGMGAVYKVRNVISDRVEAMKVLLPNLVAEPGLADRFLREIKLLGKLDHPNITGLRTAFRANDQLWMVMELVDGSTLEQVLRERRPTIEESIRYTRQALEALAYAHEMGVVHRDLKPANMILTAKGQVKLTDFGIAREDGDSRLTKTGTALGSLAYMSPEQIQRGNVDGRSDLYSLGITFYELLTGQLPFNAESEFAIMSAHVMHAPRPPVELNPAIPAHLSAVILRSLSKGPAQRFQTAREFHDALEFAPAVTRISTPVEVPALPAGPKRPPLGWAIGSVASVAVLTGAYVFLRQTPLTPRVPQPQVPVAQSAPEPIAKSTPEPTPPAAVPTPLPKQPTPAPTPALDPAQKEWETLATSRDVNALNAFREKNPGTPYARQAFLRIVEVQWESARDSKDPARLRRFRETHPNSAYASEALAEVERLEKAAAVKGITDALDRLRTACESRDLPALRRVWPTLAGRRLQMTAAMLKNASTLKVQAEIVGDVQVAGDMAIVPVHYRHEAARQTGETLSVDEKVSLTMKKTGGEWFIQNFPALREGMAPGMLKKRQQ